MAPWDIDSARPADDDIISQFPANERNSRSQIEGWMDYEHDKTTGRHKIPAGTTTTRDGITEFVDGALWINTSFTPARLQMRVSGAWKDVGAGFAGDASIEGALTIVGSAATRLIVERTGNANNSIVEFKTTDGSMFAGRANDTYFAIGSSNNLNTSGNRWFEVAADHARVRGDFYATGTITGNGSGLTNLNASNLTTGTLPNARMSGNYSFGGLTLSGNLSVGGTATINSLYLATGGSVNTIRSNGTYLDFSPDGNDGQAISRFFRASPPGLDYSVSFHAGTAGSWLRLSSTDGVELSVGTFSGNGSGLTNLNASNISSGTLPAARLPNHSANLLTSGTLPNGRLSGNYSFANLTLSGSLSTNHIRVGADTSYVINRNTNNSWLELEGGTGGGSSSRIMLYGPNSSNGRGDLRHGDTVRLRWGNSSVQADNGASGLHTINTVESSSDVDLTDYTIGTTVLARGSHGNRNSTLTVRLNSDGTTYSIGGSGTVLSGTWRYKGQGGDNNNVVQRVA